MTERIRGVALILMKGEEGDATIDVLSEKNTDIMVHDFGTYWKVEHPTEIVVQMGDIGEALGRPITLSEWLVIMSSFIGRAQPGADYFKVSMEMTFLTDLGLACEPAGPAMPRGGRPAESAPHASGPAQPR